MFILPQKIIGSACNRTACARCGKPLEEIETEYCVDCEKKRRGKYDFLRQGTALWVYTDSLKEAMASFKYEAVMKMQRFFAEEFIRFRKENCRAWKPDFLLPVPPHRHRRWFRGYNQAEILAEEIGKRLHLPVETDVLCRSLDTSPQKQYWMIRRDTGICQVLSMFRRVPVIS